MKHKTISRIFMALAVTGHLLSAGAQEVAIPDLGLNTAVRQALQKPAGPLTVQDMLGLIQLSAGGRSISNVNGLEAARNLRILDLDANSLTNFPITEALTNLTILDLFRNRLPRFGLSNPPPNLEILNIAFNSLGECSLPAGMTNLDTLFLEGNALTNFELPVGLIRLTQLDLSANGLTHLSIPTDATNLVTAALFANPLTNLNLPPNLNRLGSLDLDSDHLPNIEFPQGLTRLASFLARDNRLTNLTFRADMTNLAFVDVGGNQLMDVSLPVTLPRLNFLRLPDNKLSSFRLPAGLTNLTSLFLHNNQLTNVLLAAGLIRLEQIDLRSNDLTSLTLPPDMTNLTTLLLDQNPLATLVLSEPLAATRLAATVAALRNQGVQVFTYPLSIHLTLPRQQPIGAFRFGITGPPGMYTVFSSSNLTDWSPLIVVSNPLGSVFVADTTAHLSSPKFYRVSLPAPSNMVFIPPNTFTMGSPTNELHRQSSESPQTTVTLSRGFWIGAYEVTQAEYLGVTGTNPSTFTGDLSRPVSSVSWPDATNYCWLLTEREIAAGRIPAGSRYRLPTEAEWECAARAGTTTRFSYGDDPDYTSLTNYGWQNFEDGLTVHPVGQKLPNPWGLYDTMGNVFEWCQDWFGPLSGGAVTDPQGAASNSIGWKVMRGGAFDFGGSACRSASRNVFPNHPALSDWNLGFRVVLVMGMQ